MAWCLSLAHSVVAPPPLHGAGFLGVVSLGMPLLLVLLVLCLSRWWFWFWVVCVPLFVVLAPVCGFGFPCVAVLYCSLALCPLCGLSPPAPLRLVGEGLCCFAILCVWGCSMAPWHCFDALSLVCCCLLAGLLLCGPPLGVLAPLALLPPALALKFLWPCLLALSLVSTFPLVGRCCCFALAPVLVSFGFCVSWRLGLAAALLFLWALLVPGALGGSS